MRSFVSLLILCSSFFSYISAETLSLRADIWCPYNCDPNSDKPGFMVEIAKHVFEKLGYKIDYELMNWSQAVEETREGKYTALVGALHGDAPDFIFPDNEQGIAQEEFWVKKDSSWKYKDITSLNKMDLGAILAYSYGVPIDTYIQDNKDDTKKISLTTGHHALELNINKLLEGNIDTFIEDHFVVQFYLKQHNQIGLIKPAGALDPQNLYIAFSPKNPDSTKYARILSEAMPELRKSGQLQKILDKYGIEDWIK